jgi:hypothetical protein
MAQKPGFLKKPGFSVQDLRSDLNCVVGYAQREPHPTDRGCAKKAVGQARRLSYGLVSNLHSFPACGWERGLG